MLAWLIEQKASDTIEELTDELLENIIKNNEYVVVYFSGFFFHFFFLNNLKNLFLNGKTEAF